MAILTFSDFSGGLYESQALRIYSGPNSLLQAQNIEYFVSGGGEVKIRGRRGVVRYTTSAEAGVIRSLYRHSRRSGARSLLVAYENGSGNITFKHDTNDDGTLEVISGVPTTTTGARWHFATWPSQDATYMVSTAASGADGLRKYDPGAGTPITTVSLTGVSVDGPYLTVWKDRLWVTKASELNYSVYASELNDPTTFPATNQLSVNDPEGGIITGLVAFGDSLLIFKNTGIWRFTGDIEFSDSSSQLTQYSDVGCIAPETIENIPGIGIIFLSQYGLRLTDGQDPHPFDVSYSILPNFITPSTQSAYSSAFGKYHPRKGIYYLFLSSATTPYKLSFFSSTPVGSPRGRSDKFLWSKDSWFQSQANTNNSTITPYCLTNETSEGDNGDFFVGDSQGKIWKVDYGVVDSDTVSSVVTDYSIYPKIQTAFVPMDAQLGRMSRAGRFYISFRGKTTVQCEVRFDHSTSAAASFSIGQDTPGYIYQQVWRAVSTHSSWGRLASAVVTLPSDSYESELDKIVLEIINRGGRVRTQVGTT